MMNLKNVKYFLLIFSIFLLSGCTAQYDLYISSDGEVIESISGKVKNKELDNDNKSDYNTYLYMLNYATPIVGDIGEYDKKVIDKKKSKEFNYTYVFDDYSTSNALNTCFSFGTVIEDDYYYYIRVQGDFTCQYADSIKISIDTDYIVTDTNANYKNGKYTWTINKNNNTDLDLYIDILKEENQNYNKKSSGMSTFRIVGLVVLLILGLITYLLYKKSQNEN